jgi:hypothetical protein
MNIRWRLSILAIQLALLALISYSVTGRVCVTETWYFAGLLAIVINPQLLEPYYPRPVDVVANALIVLVLIANEKKTVTTPGWVTLKYFAVAVMLFAAIALVLGAGKRRGPFIGLASSARVLSQIGSARVLYSAVFVLSVHLLVLVYARFSAFLHSPAAI